MRMTAAFLVLALSSPAAGRGPKVEFEPMRKATVLPMGQCEVDVVFRLVVDDGGSEDYFCPRVEWRWEDESVAVEESDCPPFAEAAVEDHRRVWMRPRDFQNSGRYLVRARLIKGDRVVRRLETIAIVTGWSGFVPERRQEFGCSPARAQAVPPPATFPPLAPFPTPQP